MPDALRVCARRPGSHVVLCDLIGALLGWLTLVGGGPGGADCARRPAKDLCGLCASCLGGRVWPSTGGLGVRGERALSRIQPYCAVQQGVFVCAAGRSCLTDTVERVREGLDMRVSCVCWHLRQLKYVLCFV